MLSDASEFGYRGLLQDLLKFVFSNEENKLILVKSIGIKPEKEVHQSICQLAAYSKEKINDQDAADILAFLKSLEKNPAIN